MEEGEGVEVDLFTDGVNSCRALTQLHLLPGTVTSSPLRNCLPPPTPSADGKEFMAPAGSSWWWWRRGVGEGLGGREGRKGETATDITAVPAAASLPLSLLFRFTAILVV